VPARPPALACAAVCASLLLGAAPAAAAPALPDAPPGPVLEDGVTAPVLSYADAVRETVWVTAPDGDGDGEPDLVAADIIRPSELDADVPVVMVASPYYLSVGRGNESEYKEYDEQGRPTQFPLYYDNYFVPRGYAFVAVDTAGTGRSTGCVDQGGLSDVGSAAAVVEWLAGEGEAVDADGEPVEATWSSGRTGMIGKSYDGTIANGVAAAGTTGLETIVPIGAISSWYDYTRYQGLPFSYDYPSWLSSYVMRDRTREVDCTAQLAQMDAEDGDESGAYTDFWAERDYRDGSVYDASQVTASVFAVHGLQDDNVKTPNVAGWWEALGEAGVERRLWLTRVGHTDPFDSDRAEWVRELHRWFDHELMDVDNGVDAEAPVRVETAPGVVRHERTWPAPTRTLRLTPDAEGLLAPARRARGEATFTNDPAQREADAVVEGADDGRLLWTTGALSQDVRVSGTPRVDLDVTHTAETGQVGVLLVDYGAAERVLSQGNGATTLETESCWGESTELDDACYLDVAQLRGTTPLQVLARGAARLDGPGRHDVTVEMTAQDVDVPAGHRIGLVVVGAYRGWTATVDAAPTPYSVQLGSTALHLPVQGLAAFRGGPADLPEAADLTRGTLPELERVVVPQ